MKVCIVTLQYTNNYGAVLQCYALQKALEGLGHAANVLNFSALKIERLPWWRGWGLKSGLSLASLRSKYLRLRYSEAACAKFDKFRSDHLKSTQKINSLGDVGAVLRDYDAVIVGSDQVWNQKWHHPVYYLGDESLGSIPKTIKKISYAASAGSGEIPLARREKIKGWLAQFHAISVRDEFTRRLLQNSLGVESTVTCDPTLLEDFPGIEDKSSHPPEENYILAYFLHERSRALAQKTLTRFSKRLGLPVYAITVSAHEAFRPPGADHYLNEVGPAEWHRLFRKAGFVCTDSFHGSIFSAKFRKPFVYCISEEGTGVRLDDAAERYAFTDARVTSTTDLDAAVARAQNRDFDKSSRLIREHAEFSKEFLAKSLPV